jgi:hypothetical protein
MAPGAGVLDLQLDIARSALRQAGGRATAVGSSAAGGVLRSYPGNVIRLRRGIGVRRVRCLDRSGSEDRGGRFRIDRLGVRTLLGVCWRARFFHG